MAASSRDRVDLPGTVVTGRIGVTMTTAAKVLVVEDEAPLARVVAEYLRRAGFDVITSGDGAEAVNLARVFDPDVVVLDLGLPGLDGVEVCRQLRTFSSCYVLMLTARAEEIDKLVGLSVGADDYLTKPASMRELVARVQVLLRRPRTHSAAGINGILRFGDLVVDVEAREVSVAGRPVELTRTEFDLLAALAARPRMVFTRRQLIDAVWGPSWVGDEHVVDVHIGHVRRKLGDDAEEPKYIRTVRGVGYRMGSGT